MKYLIWGSLIIAIIISIMCFAPMNNQKGAFSGYQKIETTSTKVIEAQQKEEELIRKQKKEEKIITKADTMDMQREYKDVLNSFFNAVKNLEIEECMIYLTDEKFNPGEEDVITKLKYNEEYNFFKNYLKSFQFTINEINTNETEEAVDININIRRYNINKLASKLAKMQEENEEYQVATYEELLFEYEKYFRDEFMKTNVVTSDEEYDLQLVKVDDKWLIKNDLDLANIIVDLEFKLDKDYKPEEKS